jgi:exosortase
VASPTVSRWDWYCLVLPVISISPLLYLQATLLWSKQHLQFFPLTFLAAAWFIRTEGVSFLSISNGRTRASIFLWAVGIFCCWGAILLYSSWLAHLALIVHIIAWCLGKFANLSTLRILGICGLLSVALPPPNNRDQLLVRSLQSLSTNVSSWLMDITDILHVQSGNVIDIESKSLFVEEACSGVDSQYALMAVAGTLLLVGRAGLFVSLVTIVTVPIWAILGNLLRIYSIVIGIEYLGIDLSLGTLHTVLGLATFSLAAWAHWSSVQFLNWLSLVPSNAALAGGVPAMPKDNVLKRSFETESISSYLPRWSVVFPGALMLATPVLTASALFSQLDSLSLPKLTAETARILPTKNDLPRSQSGGEMILFAIQERGRDDLMGQHSRIWSFSKEDIRQTLSLDLPFRSWHELWVCYEKNGWEIRKRDMVTLDGNGQLLDWPYFEIRLENAVGEFAVLQFSHFLKNGEPFVYSQSDARLGYGDRNTRWIFPKVVKQLKLMQEPEPVTFQFQLLSRTSEPATDEQIAQFRSLFLEARETIREKSIPAFRKLMGE